MVGEFPYFFYFKVRMLYGNDASCGSFEFLALAWLGNVGLLWLQRLSGGRRITKIEGFFCKLFEFYKFKDLDLLG